MRIGIVSDIHCNHRGLAEALRLLDSVDRILCLGDSIYEYRFSNDTVALLRQRDVIAIRGNHEEVFFGPHGARARAMGQMDAQLAGWLTEQPHTRMLELGGVRIHMVHSTPWAPHREYIFPGSPEFPRMAESGADLVLYGHTHHAVAQHIGDSLILNPGSAGEARGAGDDAFLSCAIYDTQSREASILRYADPTKGD